MHGHLRWRAGREERSATIDRHFAIHLRAEVMRLRTTNRWLRQRLREEAVPRVADHDSIRVELMELRRADIDAVRRRQSIRDEEYFGSGGLLVHRHREAAIHAAAARITRRACHRRRSDRE